MGPKPSLLVLVHVLPLFSLPILLVSGLLELSGDCHASVFGRVQANGARDDNSRRESAVDTRKNETSDKA